METHVLKERLAFVQAVESGHWGLSEACTRFGISRPTGYKWRDRYRAEGEAGLLDISRAPHACTHRLEAALEAQVVAARRRYGWGAKKLLHVLRTDQPEVVWPARSTVNAILQRHGLLVRRRRRQRWAHPGTVPLVTDQPNQVWPADFKGQFRTGDGAYCYPLTITDHYSRRLLACEGLRAIRTADVHRVFRALFRRVGLPEAIRTDNGLPFVSTGVHGLTTLNVWWMQLGIVHQRITPASPQENGTHERMHRELKRETTRPPAATLAAQQRRFASFRHRYNAVRPHEGIGNQTPDSRWTASPRPYPERLPRPAYAASLEIRRVTHGGTFWLRNQQWFLSKALAGHNIGLEEVDDGLWNIVYYQTLLARFDARTGRVTGLRPAQSV